MINKQNIRVAIAQINSRVGDIEANLNKIKQFIEKANKNKVDIISFPELSICGYPPEDLLLKDKFIKENISAVRKVAAFTKNIIVVLGFANRVKGNLYNAAAIIFDKKIRGVYHKVFLPNYGVFDEKRYFSAGSTYPVFSMSKVIFGINICEDIWHKDGPLYYQAYRGAQLIININASPYYMSKGRARESLLIQQARMNKVFIVYTNLVGGQDELVFDGQSLIVDDKGKIVAKSNAFEEELRVADLEIAIRKAKAKPLIIKKDTEAHKPKVQLIMTKTFGVVEEVYQALILGLKDYVSKNGFKKVIVGLSGGIDSSLVATLAVDALGLSNVVGVFMPSQYSSEISRDDAYKLAENLDISIKEIPIKNIFNTYLSELNQTFEGCAIDVTEENLQARIRGNILMSLSNKFGWLVLTTGNKSEVSCGYCTLYGDMAGGFSVIKDVPKTLVYKLAKFRNEAVKREIIPSSVINKEPTAELRPNQKDSDALPTYNLLDAILKKYVEENKSMNEIVKSGYDRATVSKVISLVDKNEYKRRQSAPGIKITPKAFGKDRRMPITNRFRSELV